MKIILQSSNFYIHDHSLNLNQKMNFILINIKIFREEMLNQEELQLLLLLVNITLIY